MYSGQGSLVKVLDNVTRSFLCQFLSLLPSNCPQEFGRFGSFIIIIIVSKRRHRLSGCNGRPL